MMTATIALRASDVSGQHAVRATAVPGDSTISELLNQLLAKMGLARHDVKGRQIRYRALLERESRHLDAHERVSEALQPEDLVVLTPNVEAGAGRA
jgi:predicted transcriptional regulator